jgi:holo-[acyl-carrier protein] synthase
VGVDLVDVAGFEIRFRACEAVLAEIFTDGELAYCRRQPHPWPHLAARFAAKEAFLKALTSGLAGAMRWRDIEVVRDPAGTPRIRVSGATAEAMARERLTPGSVSLSHTATHAMAVVLLASP